MGHSLLCPPSRFGLVLFDCCWLLQISHGQVCQNHWLGYRVKGIDSRTAVPDALWSDGRLQLSFKQFCQFAVQWKLQHKMTSPHYPQSNGKAEATVKVHEKDQLGMVLDGDKLCRALLQCRSTPSTRDGLSPAQSYWDTWYRTTFQPTAVPSLSWQKFNMTRLKRRYTGWSIVPSNITI